MKTLLKVLVRMIGTLAGFVGANLIVILLIYQREKPDWHVAALVTPSLGCFAAYFFYVTFLVWRRVSPLAVQHVSFVLALVLLATLGWCLFFPEPRPSGAIVFSLRHFFLFAVSILAAYAFYRVCRFGFEHVLFRPQKGIPEPPLSP